MPAMERKTAPLRIHDAVICICLFDTKASGSCESSEMRENETLRPRYTLVCTRDETHAYEGVSFLDALHLACYNRRSLCDLSTAKRAYRR